MTRVSNPGFPQESDLRDTTVCSFLSAFLLQGVWPRGLRAACVLFVFQGQVPVVELLENRPALAQQQHWAVLVTQPGRQLAHQLERPRTGRRMEETEGLSWGR